SYATRRQRPYTHSSGFPHHRVVSTGSHSTPLARCGLPRLALQPTLLERCRSRSRVLDENDTVPWTVIVLRLTMYTLLAVLAPILTSFLPILNKSLLRDTRTSQVAWAINAASLPLLAVGTLFLTQC